MIDILRSGKGLDKVYLKALEKPLYFFVGLPLMDRYSGTLLEAFTD